MSPRAALGPVAGAAALALVVWWSGSGPVVDGIRAVDAAALAAGALIAVPVTVASAWRWRLVAAGLGAELPLTTAIAGYYRSQFLNCTLPGGVVGDVHRGLRHGRQSGHRRRAMYAVASERLAGQVVQASVAAMVLLVLPSPVPRAVTAGVALAVALLLVLTFASAGATSRRVRRLRRTRLHVGLRLLRGRTGTGVAVASLVAVAGHVATWLVAAHAVGVAASPYRLLPLGLLVLLAMAIPFNLLGFGPREGVAAWCFAAVGLGAGAGVATAVAYGVIVLVATLPGVVVLAVDGLRPGATAPLPRQVPGRPESREVARG